MSTSTETRIPATPTTDDLHPVPDGLEQLRDWVRSQPLGLVHARLHAPSPTFTADELDMVSDAVNLEAIDSIAQWSAEAAALHDFYRRHHSLVTALRELIGEGFRTVADLHHQWKVDTGVDHHAVRRLLSAAQAASIGRWGVSLAEGSLAVGDRDDAREDALGEMNNAAEALLDLAGQVDDARLDRLAERLERIDENDFRKMRRILPDMDAALRDTYQRVERDVVFGTARHRYLAAAAA